MEPIDVKIKIYLGYKYTYMYIQRNKSCGWPRNMSGSF